MITRKMNKRITFFKRVGGQNEDGEVVQPQRVDVVTCWSEVKKTSVKDFQRTSQAQNGSDGLQNSLDSKVFLIRYVPKFPIDTSMFVDFNGLEYKITSIEVDYSGKEMIMVRGERIT